MIFGEKSTEARVTSDSLVATFHKANPPLVWKFDLERNHSFTLALQGEEGDWELGLTSPKGDFYPITHFLTREDAEEAFKAVDKALMRRKASYVWLAAKVVFGLILVGLFAFLLAFFLPLFSKIYSGTALPPNMRNGMPMQMPQGMMMPQMPQQGMTIEQAPQGLPLPADKFLKAPTTFVPPPAPTPAPVPTPMGVPVPADEVLKAPH